jgi:hypothetical protein
MNWGLENDRGIFYQYLRDPMVVRLNHIGNDFLPLKSNGKSGKNQSFWFD